MAILNITYQGVSADYELGLEGTESDADLRRIAVEVVRSGGARGLHVPELAAQAFDDFVIDRLATPEGAARFYLRPKVPFGGAAA